MSQPAIGQKQTTVLLLVMVALLAAIVAVLVWQNSRPATPAPISSAMPADTGLTAGMPPANMGTPSAPAEFDPATAPVVPAGVTPEEYVLDYYESCAAKDYEKAFTLLPAATQQNYGTAASFEQTLEGYGIAGFSVDPPVEGDGTVSVVGYQEAQGMTFAYEWKFVEGDDGQWLVASRTMAGTK